jgi:hypothetical protein
MAVIEQAELPAQVANGRRIIVWFGHRASMHAMAMNATGGNCR